MKKLKICLVDDDREDREIFQEAFEELNSGSDLKIFDNGLEVMQYLENLEHVPDIIFLDINMPVMGGLETLREIRKVERYRSITVVIYSTSSAENDIEQTLISGANIYLTKPSSYQSLKDAISKIMKYQFHAGEVNRDTFVLVV
ncbi:response regulator [Sphingobacterium siyangense]|uniref:response regulator n=1 Tax=Sphingobacterium siyangense TaxID=459529 RepID=UPI00196445D0|nr:response regulator [Sphingobacterium siyangense]QRY55492.1 response regulator [Sphingobacterium siyangense]